jgi:hypothetical protein
MTKQPSPHRGALAALQLGNFNQAIRAMLTESLKSKRTIDARAGY